LRLPVAASSRTQLKFNITPLIDIVFLLIIFFLVASHFVRNEIAEAVDLPVASVTTDDNTADVGRITITVNAEGTYSISGVPMDSQKVAFRIDQLHAEAGEMAEVRIRADRLARYRAVKDIIELCASHQISSIQFAVLNADEPLSARDLSARAQGAR